ncbi:hypothetical protein ACJZ2D_007733 [Fusarium nematophilum]
MLVSCSSRRNDQQATLETERPSLVGCGGSDSARIQKRHVLPHHLTSSDAAVRPVALRSQFPNGREGVEKGSQRETRIERNGAPTPPVLPARSSVDGADALLMGALALPQRQAG